MTNAEKFKQTFGIYATELWAMPEKEFLAWLNAEAKTEDWIPCSERLPNKDGEYIVTKRFSNVFPPDVYILRFAKDLYELDEYDFYNRKGKAGFCQYDSEYGYSEVNGVIAWREKPESFREYKNDSVQGDRNGND